MDRTECSNCKSIKPTNVEDRQDAIINREDFKRGLGKTITEAIHIDEGQGMDNITEVGEGMI